MTQHSIFQSPGINVCYALRSLRHALVYFVGRANFLWKTHRFLLLKNLR